MNFLGLGPGELLLVMVLALIVFGPQRLPEIGKGLGKAVAEFRRTTSAITEEFNRELQLESLLNPPAQATAATTVQEAPSPAPVAEVSPSSTVETAEPAGVEAAVETAETVAPAAEGNGEAEAVAAMAEAAPTSTDGLDAQTADEVKVEASAPQAAVEEPQSTGKVVEG